ncbi:MULTISPECIES: endospore germination permease [Dehalobacter]|uniref:GerAB/ArcD/ProY family transporter n=1 Tax=Dehalobacter TaxID=56112 RepID=UPI00258AABFF|nr:endospore germination permease [Dehalobacter sp.]MDJ0304806.1 endospore germination permease [Dehalobacter sp.]
MRLERGIISSSQLMFLVAGYVQGSVLVVAFTNVITKQYTWLVVLSGLAASVPFAMAYVALARKFPGKDLIQINHIIYGPYLGKLLSASYIWFFCSIAGFMLTYVGEIIKNYMMPETPKFIICILFAFICAWAVRNGIEILARTGVIFVMVIIIVILITFVLLLKDMELTNFLPFFDLPLKDFIQGTHIMLTLPFCEIMVFLMLIPYVNKGVEAKKSVILGLIIGGASILIDTVRNTAVLGITSTIMVSPSIESVRLIDLAEIITRLEMLVITLLLIAMFIKVTVMYYGTVLGIARLFNLRSYRPLVLPIGSIIVSLSILSFDYLTQNVDFGARSGPFFTLTFESLPVLTLLVAKIRKLPK